MYFSPTWTRLDGTAAAGQSWVRLKEGVNWRPGQLVAVMTSIFRDEWNNQNEARGPLQRDITRIVDY